MLWARCITIIGRTVFPDCLSGISYTPEELGAEVNEDGEIISIPGDDKKENKSVGTNTKQTILDHVSPRDPKSKVSQSEGETLIECAKAAGWQRVEVLNFTEANYGVKKISDLLVADYTDFMENVFQLGMSYQQAMKNVLEFSGPSDETEAPL